MNAPRIFANSVAALAALLLGTHVGLADSAAWRESGTTGGWHDPANWTPATVPNGPADVATFGSTDQLIPFALVTANTEVNGIVFNPGAPSYSIGGENVTFTISGTGITNNSAAIQFLLAAGASGVLRFQNSASAGNANSGVIGQNGGTVLFTGSSTGGSARLFAQSTGAVDISGLTTGGMTAGYIITDNTGSNFFRLGSKTLTVGGANLDSTVWGVIADGGASGGVGGSIVKVGTGTMTYAGFVANTYTGTTFVNEGTLVLNKAVEAIRGPLVVGDASGAAASAVLQCIGANEIIHNSQTLTVNDDGRFDLGAAVTETIGALTVNTGNVRLFNGTRLIAGGPLVMTGGTIEAPSGPGSPGIIYLSNSTIQATSDSTGAAAIVSAPVLLNNSTSPFTFMVSDGPGATDMVISGRIDSTTITNGIAKAGSGVMVLSGNNTYTGATRINAGTLSIFSDANLGAPPAFPRANHLVFDGGTLRATATFTLNENRGIALDASGGTVEVTEGNSVIYSGIVAGAGSLTKTGPGSLSFFGGGNTYTGTTTVNEGILGLAKAGGSIAGPLVIGDGLGAASSAVVQNGGSQISDAATVTIQPDGRLGIDSGIGDQIGSLMMAGGNVQMGIASSLQVAGALTMTGGAILGGTTTLFGAVTASSDAGGLAATISSAVNLGAATRTFTVNDGPGAVDLNITHPISNGGITKTGAGTLALGGAGSYSGPTTIIAGKLLLTGSITGSTTTVANGATLQGTGTTGPLTINAGATLVPGLSVGTLTTGNLTLDPGSTSSFELAVANVAGGGVNDLIHVNGDLVVGGTVAITMLPGFGPGTYPLITYTNTATNLGLAFESAFLSAHPGSTIQLDTINKRVVANIAGTQFLSADFDEDGDVDAADLTKWSAGFGTASGAVHVQGDADGDHDVDGRDFLIWQQQLGGGPADAVPEPATWALLVLALPLIRRHRLRKSYCFPRTSRGKLAGARQVVPPLMVALACATGVSSAQALNITVDYSYDLPANGGTGFFEATPAAIAAVNAAAADLSVAIGPSLSAVPTDVFTGVNGGATATINTFLDFINPCANIQVVIENYSPVAADAFTVYAGMRRLSSGTVAEARIARVQYLTASVNGPAADQAGAIAAAKSAADASLRREGGGDPGPINNRAQLGADQPAVGAFAGPVSFDFDTDNDGVNDGSETLDAFWHYDHTAPVPTGQYDFYTVALHEILHTLGIGIRTAETWQQMHTQDTWNGVHARALNGGSGANLLSLNQDHIAETFISTRITDGAPQASVITPTSGGPGVRRFLTAIDLAFLQDIGYALAPSFSAADFNEDGFVDGADLAKWTTGFGAASNAMHMQGDADGDHDIDGGDFLIWQRHLGSGLPAVVPSAAVPEPATIVVLLVATAGYRLRGSRRAWEVPKLVEP